MKVGIIGLGKLGLPVAVTMAYKGHRVLGYDVNPGRMNKGPQPFQETGPNGSEPFEPYLQQADGLSFAKSVKEVVEFADIVFLAVQTPHNPAYEGVTPIPYDRQDFDYTWLEAAVEDVVNVGKTTPFALVIISTCLPGTMAARIKPLLPDNVKLVYNPFFIAMGTVMWDFLNPEFVLIGVDDPWAASLVVAFYRTITPAPRVLMAVESAELTKVAYNTYIGFKIAFVNTLQQICHNIPGAKVDEVTDALKWATRRLISPAYLTAGMGDGGGCHPRDNIAMSWLARQMDMGFDLFEAVMLSREAHCRWIAHMAVDKALQAGLKHIILLGIAFKPGTNISTGSPARLLFELIQHRMEDTGAGKIELDYFDPVALPGTSIPAHKALYIISCRHDQFSSLRVPVDSVVIDPFRYWQPQPGVEYIPLGIGRPNNGSTKRH